MLRRFILVGSALAALMGTVFVPQQQAEARHRRCCNGYGYGQTYYNNGYANNGYAGYQNSNYYSAPAATSACQPNGAFQDGAPVPVQSNYGPATAPGSAPSQGTFAPEPSAPPPPAPAQGAPARNGAAPRSAAPQARQAPAAPQAPPAPAAPAAPQAPEPAPTQK